MSRLIKTDELKNKTIRQVEEYKKAKKKQFIGFFSFNGLP